VDSARRGWGRWSGYAGDVYVKGLTATLTGALLASVAARRRDGQGFARARLGAAASGPRSSRRLSLSKSSLLPRASARRGKAGSRSTTFSAGGQHKAPLVRKGGCNRAARVSRPIMPNVNLCTHAPHLSKHRAKAGAGRMHGRALVWVPCALGSAVCERDPAQGWLCG
jgi:hypothetical protein